ncbi:hypothetical protein KC734_18265 [candidate division KSB1 bacterium]|nr:hypothetical protein [candidate division KSB1 bacterium]
MIKFIKTEITYHSTYVALILLAHMFNLFIILATDFSVDFLAIWFIFPFIISGHILGREHLNSRMSAFVLLPLAIRKIAAMRVAFVFLLQYGGWLVVLLFAAPFIDFSTELLYGLLSLYGAITGLVFTNVISSDLNAYQSKKSKRSRFVLVLLITTFFFAFAFIAIIEPGHFQYNDIVLFLKSAPGFLSATLFCVVTILFSLTIFIRRPSFLK